MPASVYLVTGGSGFCGFEIVKFLQNKGETVKVLDIEGLPQPIPGVEFIRADIRDLRQVEAATRSVDKIIHTAAKVPISKAGKGFWEVNVEGTRHVLEAAKRNGVSKVVHISSSAVQMSKRNPVAEDAPYHPVGLYARTKKAAEDVCAEYSAKGLRIDVMRPRTVIGAGRLGIFSILFDWISEGKNIYILGSGKNKIQFLSSEDLASVCYLASLNTSSGSYNVGSRTFASLREDLGALIRHAGTRSKILSLPVAPCIALLSTLDFFRLSPLASWHYLTYHKDFYFDNAKAKQALGWEPKSGNQEILITAYNDYLENAQAKAPYGTSHRKALHQGLLKWIKRLS